MLEFRVRPEELAQANGIDLTRLRLYFQNHGLDSSQYDFQERPERARGQVYQTNIQSDHAAQLNEPNDQGRASRVVRQAFV
jgi:hypothetical protein